MNADVIWGWTALGFAVLVPVALWAGHVDRRRLSGVSVWAKPFKFALSLAIHYATFALIASYLPDDGRRGTENTFLAAASSSAGVCEFLYISLQAARGRHSHFNDSTAVERAASLLMGIGALVVISPAAVIGLVLIVSPPTAWPLTLSAGTSLGLIGGTILTVWTASRMGVVRSHFASGNSGSDRVIPIAGWSLDSADLRPAHFFATHMMQALPVASVIACQTLPTSVALSVVVLAAIVWAGMTMALCIRTMQGYSLSEILKVRSAG